MKGFSCIFLLLFSFYSFGKSPSDEKINFITKPFSPAFIENKGQYDSYDVNFQKNNFKRPSYGSQLGNSILVFSGNSIQFIQNIKIESEGEEEQNEIEKEEPRFETIRQRLTFIGAALNPEYIASDQRPDYFTFQNPSSKNETIKTFGWNHLLVKNIYPGIDVTYTYLDDGLKYSFLIHPGADPSLIKMKWTGMDDFNIDGSGNLLMNSRNGLYKDSAPETYYADHSSKISSAFIIDRNVISFSLDNYDHMREVVIDPWMSNPNFTFFNAGYDVQHDPAGNIYVYGGANPYQLRKYSQLGMPLWTYNTSAQGYYGDFTIDSLSNIYCIYGPWTNECLKLDSLGNVVWHSVNSNHASYVETYRIQVNPSTGLLNVIGMDRLTAFNPMAETIDPVNGAFSTYYYHPTCTVGETRALIIDANGDLYAMIFSAGGPFAFSNLLWKMDPTFATVTTVNSGYMFGELEQTYTDSWYNGFNGMAVNATALYTYDGETVKKWDKNSLAVLDSVIIPGGIHYQTGGLCTDECGNIYVGGPTSIIEFDSTLTFVDSVSTNGLVHDVNLGASPGEIIACGTDFVGSFDFPVCLGALPVAIFTAPNHICPGTCTDFINQSSNGFTFLWSFPGGVPSVSTDVNPANICYNSPGSYDVTLIATNSLGSDTLFLSNFITVYPHPPAQGIQQIGDTLFAIPGAVSYQWYSSGNIIPGATDDYYVAPASGNYNVVATDINNCEVEAVIYDVIAGLSPIMSGDEAVRLFPNPVKDELTIECSFQGPYEISVFNVPGEELYSKKGSGKDYLDCTLFPSGMYYIVVLSHEQIFRMKFVKQ